MTANDWTAVSAVATAAAAVATAVTVIYNHFLWRETAKARQADLMLRLMREYDQLRREVEQLQGFWMESASAGKKATELLADGMALLESIDERIKSVDDSRFALSRYFQSIRRLVRAGVLSEKVVVASIERTAIERVFLGLVDPLDEAVARPKFNDEDREFFRRLLHQYPGR
jgi:hypothetical protein